MDDRVLRFRVGVVVLASLIVTAILVMMFGVKPQFLESQYLIKIGFPRAPGVERNTPVRKNGVVIGRVDDVQLRDEEQGGGVILTVRVDRDRKLRMNEQPRIGVGSLVTGDAVLEFVRDENNPNHDFIQEGDFIPTGIVASDPLQMLVNMEDEMLTAFRSIDTAAHGMQQVFTTLQNKIETVLDEQQVERVLSGVEEALASFSDAADSVTSFVSDPKLRERIAEAAEELPLVLRDARAAIDDLRRVAGGFDGVGETFRQNLENVEPLTRALGEQGGPVIETVERTVRNADVLIQELATLAQGINQGRGTLGRLAQDDQLYEQVVRILENVEQVSKRLRPIIEDIRVATDKLARDPGGEIGARGLLQPNLPGLKTGVR